MSDDGSPDYRSQRDRSIRQTLLASSGLQLTVVAVTFVSLPFVTRALTAEEYGALATLTSLVALLGFADLGIGAAVTTRLAQAQGRDDIEHSSVIISTGLLAASLASLIMLSLGCLLAWTLPWSTILGVDQVPDHTLVAAVFCTVLAAALSIVGAVGNRVLYGLQRGNVATFWLIAATLTGAGCSISAAAIGAPLYVFVLTGVGASALVSLLCTWWVLTRATGVPRTSYGAISLKELRPMARASGWFFVIAVFSALAFQTDVLVVAALLGAPAAGVFSITNRLFGLILQVLFPALMQLWPAIGEAFTRGDLDWIRSRLRQTIVLAAGASAVASAFLVLVGHQVVSFWLTPSLAPPVGLLVAMACWTTMSLASAPLFMFLNAVGHVRSHAWMAVAVGVTNLPLSWLLTHHIGLAGPAVGSLIANFCLATVPGTFVVMRSLHHAPATVEQDASHGAP